MTYIQPNGIVRLLYNVPLDSDYNDTIYFANQETQYSYFASQNGITLPSDQSYTRVDRGIFRCSLPMSQTYNVNYMMFKNTSFENKWFYAFVDKISYTNNGLCEVHFTIDVIQTWLFNGSMQNALGQCFVEREIVANDAIGSHIEPEGLDVGETVFNGLGNLAMSGTIRYIVMIVDNDNTAVNGRFYDNVFCGADLYVCDMTGIYSVISKIKNPDSVVGIYTAPVEMFSSETVLNQILIDRYKPESSIINLRTVGTGTCGSTVDGYTPKNNKLLTYPYNYYVAMTGQGKSNIYRYEYFKNGEVSFKIQYNLLPPVTVSLMPYDYKGLDKNVGEAEILYTEPLTISDYPMCSWNTDQYKMWQIQQGTVNQTNRDITSVGNIVSALGSSISMAAGILTGNPLMTAMGGIGASKTLVSEYQNEMNTRNADYLASWMADASKGNLNSGSNITSNGEMKYFGGRMSLKAERAKQIDDFFSMFGYAVRVVKQPNISSRPRWNYVKCTDVNINCAMPNDDKALCKSIFNNGIRFWKNASDIGNYSLANKWGS